MSNPLFFSSMVPNYTNKLNTKGVDMKIQDELLEDLKPFAIDMALKHYSKIEEFFIEQAAKTSTPFDDYMVGMLLSWGKGWLQDYRKELV